MAKAGKYEVRFDCDPPEREWCCDGEVWRIRVGDERADRLRVTVFANEVTKFRSVTLLRGRHTLAHWPLSLTLTWEGLDLFSDLWITRFLGGRPRHDLVWMGDGTEGRDWVLAYDGAAGELRPAALVNDKIRWLKPKTKRSN